MNGCGMGIARAETVTGSSSGSTVGAAKGMATLEDDGSVIPSDSSAVSGVAGTAGVTSSKGSTGPGASGSFASTSESVVAGLRVSRLSR